MNDIILSICITSYNRPKELARCLNSIDVRDKSIVEIIVSEDLSPKREEIRSVLEDFSQKSDYKVISNFNEKNLGYDRNLGKLISIATGEYIIFCSDDDTFMHDQLQALIDVLLKDKPAMVLSSYKSNDKFAFNRKYNHNFLIEAGETSAIRHLYDGILFSGLVFKKSLIQNFDSEKFVNTNYFQIYLLLKVINKYGGSYIRNCLIDCIGDGENGYGTTELSAYDPLLSDRKSLYSNLRFNKGLIKVIRIFDEEDNTNILSAFESEYSRKTYRGLARARRISKGELKKYWRELNKLNINIKFPAIAYYWMLYCFGSNICDQVIRLPKTILFLIRKNGR